MIMTRDLKNCDLQDTKKKELVLFSMRKRRQRKGKAISEYVKICLKKKRPTCFVWVEQQQKLTVATRKIQVRYQGKTHNDKECEALKKAVWGNEEDIRSP